MIVFIKIMNFLTWVYLIDTIKNLIALNQITDYFVSFVWLISSPPSFEDIIFIYKYILCY